VVRLASIAAVFVMTLISIAIATTVWLSSDRHAAPPV
jgi:hypothetical protein